MFKEIYAVKGRTAATAQYLTNAIKVKMRVDSKKRVVCHYCGRRGTIHSKRTIYIIDSPCINKHVIMEPVVPQIHCPHCGRFHTYRPDFAHPTMGFTRRFMRRVSRLQMFAPARWIAQQYSISYSAVLRIDREILRTTQPEPCIFSRLTEHEAMWQLSHWLSMAVRSGIRQVERLARGIAERYNEVINGIRYNINSASGESANAGIKRIQSKCCGLFDIDYLFMKLQQRYLSREEFSPQGA